MKETESLNRELARQYSLVFQTSNTLDHKAEQAIVFIVVILGYLLKSGSLNFLRNPEGWAQVLYIIGLLLIIVSFSLLVVAYRIQSIHVGSKQDYLLDMLKNKKDFLVPAIILGIKNSGEKVKQTNDAKAILLRWSHLFIIISISVIIICEFMLRNPNVK